MVGIYFKTDRLPVLFLVYVAITALTRFLPRGSPCLRMSTGTSGRGGGLKP